MAKSVTVEGEVVTRDGRGTAIEFYEKTFILDDAVQNESQARSVIRKGMITEALRKEVENFKHVRTCQVIEFKNTDEKPEASEVDQLLLKATQLGCVPDNIDNYKRADFKAKALEKAIAAHEARTLKEKKEDLEFVD